MMGSNLSRTPARFDFFLIQADIAIVAAGRSKDRTHAHSPKVAAVGAKLHRFPLRIGGTIRYVIAPAQTNCLRLNPLAVSTQ